MLEQALVALGETPSETVSRAIRRMAPMTQFLQMSDGGLAAFNGGGEGDPAAIAVACGRISDAVKPFGYAPNTGFVRAAAGKSVVIMDAGEPPSGPFSLEAHAGTLAFEFSAGDSRLVVNCGWADDQPRRWREAARSTAAHSTLILKETSSSRITPPDWRRVLTGARITKGCGPVASKRMDDDLGIWMEGAHEGYAGPFGFVHARQLFLSADGADLRGEDTLTRRAGAAPPASLRRIPFVIRFHLHPDIRASISRDGRSALLITPSGEGWRFRTDLAPVAIDRSVYLAAGAPPRGSEQLALHGAARPDGDGESPPNRIRWAFQRLGRVGGGS